MSKFADASWKKYKSFLNNPNTHINQHLNNLISPKIVETNQQKINNTCRTFEPFDASEYYNEEMMDLIKHTSAHKRLRLAR